MPIWVPAVTASGRHEALVDLACVSALSLLALAGLCGVSGGIAPLVVGAVGSRVLAERRATSTLTDAWLGNRGLFSEGFVSG